MNQNSCCAFIYMTKFPSAITCGALLPKEAPISPFSPDVPQNI